MKTFITILCLGLSFVLQAQQTISGTITNTQNEPLFGVEVYIEELQKGTSTNEKGYFELNNLPNNTIKLTIVFIGYKTQIKTIKSYSRKTNFKFCFGGKCF